MLQISFISHVTMALLSLHLLLVRAIIHLGQTDHNSVTSVDENNGNSIIIGLAVTWVAYPGT